MPTMYKGMKKKEAPSKPSSDLSVALAFDRPSAKPIMAGSSSAAVAALQQAIDLHAQHMDGSIPPTPESQAEMMSMLKDALASISGPSDTSLDEPPASTSAFESEV